MAIDCISTKFARRNLSLEFFSISKSNGRIGRSNVFDDLALLSFEFCERLGKEFFNMRGADVINYLIDNCIFEKKSSSFLIHIFI